MIDLIVAGKDGGVDILEKSESFVRNNQQQQNRQKLSFVSCDAEPDELSVRGLAR